MSPGFIFVFSCQIIQCGVMEDGNAGLFVIVGARPEDIEEDVKRYLKQASLNGPIFD
jgi:hypothetical protein